LQTLCRCLNNQLDGLVIKRWVVVITMSQHIMFFSFSWTGGSLQSFLVKTTANLSASNHVPAQLCGLLLNCIVLLVPTKAIITEIIKEEPRAFLYIVLRLQRHELRKPLLTRASSLIVFIRRIIHRCRLQPVATL